MAGALLGAVAFRLTADDGYTRRTGLSDALDVTGLVIFVTGLLVAWYWESHRRLSGANELARSGARLVVLTGTLTAWSGVGLLLWFGDGGVPASASFLGASLLIAGVLAMLAGTATWGSSHAAPLMVVASWTAILLTLTVAQARWEPSGCVGSMDCISFASPYSLVWLWMPMLTGCMGLVVLLQFVALSVGAAARRRRVVRG